MSNHTPVFRFVQFVKRFNLNWFVVAMLPLLGFAAGVWLLLAMEASRPDGQILALGNFLMAAILAGAFTASIVKEIRTRSEKAEHTPEVQYVFLHQYTPMAHVARAYPAVETPEEFGEFVYILQDVDLSHLFKIGHTNNLARRMGDFGVTLPFRIRCVHYIRCRNRMQVERMLHRQYAQQRVAGEWFRLTDTDIADLMRITHVGDAS